MCQFISFMHRPDNGDVFIYDLSSHSETESKLENKPLWREGHYLPDGELICRVNPDEKTTEAECVERMKNRFPTFASFFHWCMKEMGTTKKYAGNMNLDELKSAKGLVLPKKCGIVFTSL